MSAANSAAKKRRTQEPYQSSQPPQPTQPSSLQQQQQLRPQQQKQNGLTLQQVITVIDNRLGNLEKKSNTDDLDSIPEQNNYQEIETRFEILASEISDLKQIVLSLQSYTMDVNKKLLEEKNNAIIIEK